MTIPGDHRPDPEELLRWVKSKERKEGRGRLKVFLGYASGVGKSFRMLDEGRRRKERGQDVVVGSLQPQRQEEAERILQGIEVVPPREELDLEAILRRNPQVCLVDELAHDNPPGSRHPQRWQDVGELLEAGVNVITAVNIQHVQELQDAIRPLVEKLPEETVPEAFLQEADEIVLVDVSPEALSERNRQKDERTGEPEESPNLSRKESDRHLLELREIALLFAAEMVDAQLEDHLREGSGGRTFCAQERILVCLHPQSEGAVMIEAGRWIANRFHGELYVVYITSDPEWSHLNFRDRADVQGQLALARTLGAKVEALTHSDEVKSLMDFARQHRITQLFLMRHREVGWRRLLHGNILSRIIREAEGMDVRIFPRRAAA